MTSAETPVTVGPDIDVPQYVPYPPPGKVLVTPLSSSLWQPGPVTSGLSRPSSAGPQLEKYVIESSFELSAPTVMWFFAHAGGAVV